MDAYDGRPRALRRANSRTPIRTPIRTPMPPRRSGLAWIRAAARQSSMARAAVIAHMSPLICRRLTLVASLAQSHGAPRILYSNNAGSSWTSLGAATLGGQSVDAVVARGNVLLAGTFEQSGLADPNQQRVEGLYRSTDSGPTFTLLSSTGELQSGPLAQMD